MPWLSQQHNYYKVLLLCGFIVVVCCVMYVRWLWQTAALRRVPTMSYYMLDEDVTLSSVRINRSRSYTQLSRGPYNS